MPVDPSEPSFDDAQAAREAAANRVRETPLLSSAWLGAEVGGHVALKAENLQRTGSFKVRGAVAKVDRVARSAAGGVVAASAGNHGQAVAYAARARGMPCRILVPDGASISKAAAVRGYGGTVEVGGEAIEECIGRAREYAAEHRAEVIHPFDDRDVILGQATLGLELLEAEPELATLVLPIGGGGLAAGIASIVKAQWPSVSVVGVQVEGCASLAGGGTERSRREVYLADGIAVKTPGELTRPLIEAYVDEICVVSEDAIAEAMVLLMQRSKLVVEGAGAASVAALLSGAASAASSGTTVAVLSGGNVDVNVLAAVARRHEFESGRRLHLFTRIPDRPGALAEVLAVVAEAGANVLTAEHLRDALPLHIGETAIELVLETRGREHSDEVLGALREAGHSIEGEMHPPQPGAAERDDL